jgi:hypothetical protein
MGKFRRAGVGIPSNLHKRKRKPFTRDTEKTRRCGQLAEFLDVVPFLKWMYADGGVSYRTIEDITGVGVRTATRLISLTNDDPPLTICFTPGCNRIAHTKEGYCTVACNKRHIPPPPKIKLPKKQRSDLIPCINNLSCGGSVLQINPHGFCPKCRDRLPERRLDRHLKKIERKTADPVVPIFCGCGRRISFRNTKGLCWACQHM